MKSTAHERLRRAATKAVETCPGIEAVVLFGSRARGTAGTGSDWDIALIGKSGKTPEAAYRLFGELPGVRLLGFRAGEIERHKDTAGALEAALARQGVTLAGAWSRPACRKEALSMDVVRIRANLDNATDAVARAVMAGIDHLHARGRKRSDWTPVTTGSVDAAEHVAKAVLTGYGLSPREVHFLDALAEQLANAYRGRNDPRQAEWAERIRAMNGTTRTRRLHDADYRRFVVPPAEPLERSVERTGQAQRAQILWLHEMAERWPEHAEEIMDATREIADKDGGLSGWRASYASKAVTADERTRTTIARLEESTAEWIGSAEALLAGLEGGGAPPSESAAGKKDR
jgi:predicted nucleotidyltransferase/HEPN domain-containing protein